MSGNPFGGEPHSSEPYPGEPHVEEPHFSGDHLAGGFHDQAGASHPGFDPLTGHGEGPTDNAAQIPGGAEAEHHGLLDLSDEHKLPWLESDEDMEEGTVDSGRLIGAVLSGLALMAAIVGGVWYCSHRSGAGAPQPDGSIIAAPSESYKEAPKEPGGKPLAGTGDTSSAVAKGQAVTPKLAEEGAAPSAAAGGQGSGEAAAGKSAAGGSTAEHAPKALAGVGADKISGGASGAASAESAPAGGVVQIGAYYAPAVAEAAWKQLSEHSEALAGLTHRVVQGKSDIGSVYRLQVLTTPGGGAALCAKVQAEHKPCMVKN